MPNLHAALTGLPELSRVEAELISYLHTQTDTDNFLQSGGYLVDGRLTSEAFETAAKAHRALARWLQNLQPALPAPLRAILTGRTLATSLDSQVRHRWVLAVVQAERRVYLASLFHELGITPPERQAVKEYLRRQPDIVLSGRGLDAAVAWVGRHARPAPKLSAESPHAVSVSKGQTAPYNPKALMQQMATLLPNYPGFYQTLLGVEYGDDDQPSPTLNVQFDDGSGAGVTPLATTLEELEASQEGLEDLPEPPWHLITAPALKTALEHILLTRPLVKELREVRRDLRLWLLDEGGFEAQFPPLAALYLWQALREGYVTRKAFDKRKAE